MHCLKYGVTVHHVNALDCALDGRRHRAARGRRSPGRTCSASLIGSEGTLGIVTEATRRAPPAARRDAHAAGCLRRRGRGGGGRSPRRIAAGIIPAAMEFFDRAAVGFFDAFAPSGYPAEGEAFLLIDLDGSADGSVAGDQAALEPILRRGARTVHRADDDAARAALWKPRIAAALALVASGRGFFICDTTVPRERIPAMQRAVRDIGPRHRPRNRSRSATRATATFTRSSSTTRTTRRRSRRWRRRTTGVVAAALALGGTITGEHGIGSEKRRQMRLRFSPAEIAAHARRQSRVRPGRAAQPRRPPPRPDRRRTRAPAVRRHDQ